MSDEIWIRGLHVKARIGVTEAERSRPRDLRIDIGIRADLRTPGRTDDLGDTIDYAAVADRVTSLAERGESKLLEHLAERIAALVTDFVGVRGVSVELSKPDPPVSSEVEIVSVRIDR